MGQDADSDLCLALLHGPEQIADLPVPVVESPGAVVELVGYDYRRRVVAARRIVDWRTHRWRVQEHVAARRVVDPTER